MQCLVLHDGARRRSFLWKSTLTLFALAPQKKRAARTVSRHLRDGDGSFDPCGGRAYHDGGLLASVLRTSSLLVHVRAASRIVVTPSESSSSYCHGTGGCWGFDCAGQGRGGCGGNAVAGSTYARVLATCWRCSQASCDRIRHVRRIRRVFSRSPLHASRCSRMCHICERRPCVLSGTIQSLKWQRKP